MSDQQQTSDKNNSDNNLPPQDKPQDNLKDNLKDNFTDINTRHIIFKLTPKISHKYILLMRLDRLIGVYLVLFPAIWGLLSGYYGTYTKTYDISHMKSSGYILLYGGLCVIGAIIARSAGCIINDLWDRNIDKQIERTKNRPLANGSIKPRSAIILLIILGIIGISLLYSLPFSAFKWGLYAIPLIILYPLAKRFFSIPQIMLGITFNWGVFIGIACFRSVGWHDVILYIASILWTIGYDTIYAHQDIKDDIKTGVKSSAIYFNKNTKTIVSWLYVFLLVLLALYGMLINIQSKNYYLGLMVAVVLLFIQVIFVTLEEPKSCLFAFKSNIVIGLIIALSFVFGMLAIL